MPLLTYTARLSAAQLTNMAADNHIEFDIDDASSTIATVSTGVGQANGLFTIQKTARYIIDYSVRMRLDEVQAYLELRTHPGTSPLLDIAGRNLVVQNSDDSPTDDCECPNNSSIFDLTAGDVIKVAWISVPAIAALEVSFLFTAFSMMEIG